MGVVTRVSDLVVTNVNALLDRIENPEHMMAQLVRDMENGLDEARRHAAAVIANQRSVERERDSHRSQANWWKEQAREALGSGREDLARRALVRKQEHDQLGRELDVRCVEAGQNSESVRAALLALDSGLAEARRKQRELIARQRAAHARMALSGFDTLGTSAWQRRWERIESRLTARASIVSLLGELPYEPIGLEQALRALERERTVDAELAELRASSGGNPGASG
jgi:phage shock protein A